MVIATSSFLRRLPTAIALLALLMFASHCASESDAPGETDPTADTGSQTTGSGSGSGGAGGSAQGSGGTGASTGSGGNIVADIETMVHQVSGENTIEAMDAAEAPDGTLYVVWGNKSSLGTALQASRSTDGGVTFEAPVNIATGSIEVMPYFESAPMIAASNSRVAVAFTDTQSSNIWFAVSNTSGALSFGAPTPLASGGVMPKYNFPALAFAVDGELWLSWARLETPTNLPMVLKVFAARETQGYAQVQITDESNGRPCSCCGLDMLGLSTGEMLVSFRGMDSPRNQYVVRHPGTSGGNWTSVQASHTNWVFNGCPENSPQLAEIPGGGARLAWTDPTSGDSRVWLVDSFDGGVSWEDERLAYDNYNGFQFAPLLAIEPGGRTWLGWAPPINSSAQLVTSVDGQTFEDLVTLQIPTGLFKRPRVVAGASGSFAFGVIEKKSIWVVSLTVE